MLALAGEVTYQDLDVWLVRKIFDRRIALLHGHVPEIIEETDLLLTESASEDYAEVYPLGEH